MPGSVATVAILEHVLRKRGFHVPPPRHLGKVGWRWVKCQKSTAAICASCNGESDASLEVFRDAEQLWAEV